MTKKDERSRKYAEARVAGAGEKEAKEIAGYAESTRINKIERSHTVSKEIRRVLEEKGITDETLAAEYAKGMELAKQDGSKDKNLSAHAQYLKQLGFLLGHSKNTPSVAVQINNHSGTSKQLEPGRVERLVELLEAELSRRDVDGVPDPCVDVAGGSEVLAETQT